MNRYNGEPTINFRAHKKGVSMKKSRTTGVMAIVVAFMAAVAILALVVAGCGGNTPTSASQEMIEKLSSRDFGGAYDSFSSSSPVRAQIDRDTFISKMQTSLPDGTTITEFNASNEQIDGDKATVSWSAKVKMPNVDEQPLDDKFTLVKEDDTWKIDQ